MGKLACSKRGCSHNIEYQHIKEDKYYCEGCAYLYFKESEFWRIRSAKIIKLMNELSENLLDKVQDYANVENLTSNWREALDQHKIFYEELESIRIELGNSLKAKRIIISHSFQKRSTDLKSKSKYYKIIKVVVYLYI